MSKVTLSIDKEIVTKAKILAKKSNRSLSDIVERYLDKITQSEASTIDEELEKIRGIITVPEDFDEKQAVRNILTQKHL
jgi:molecular chaperone DnaK (HSP70)